MELSKRIFDLETETAFAVLAKANKLISQGRDIINLGIGQPDFPTPINIQEAAELFNECVEHPEGKEGLESFFEKRNPFWINNRNKS